MPEASNEEISRLEVLKALAILDTQEESSYNEIVELAASICSVPISLITLVDAERQWFKANKGLDGISETPRDIAFCSHAIEQDGVFEIYDASRDPRFACNPLVTDSPSIRFYAGATLRTNNGAHVGTLCVISHKPKRLSSEQRRMLSLLSATVVRMLESRRLTSICAESEARFRALSESAPLGIFSTSANGSCTYTNERWQEIFGISYDDALGLGWSQTLHSDDKDTVFSEWQRTAAMGAEFDMSFRIQKDDGYIAFVRTVSRPILSADGEICGHVGSVDDITERVEQQEALQKSQVLLAETGAMADVGGWELDVSTQKLTWTEQTFRIHELTPGNHPSLQEAISFYTADSQPVIADAVARAISEKRGWDLELPLLTATGKPIWVRSVGHVESIAEKPVRLVGAIQDVTHRVLQRQALENAHDRISIATESGDIGVWDWDVKTDRATWTPQMYSLYGLPRDTEEITYHLWLACVHPDDRIASGKALRSAIKSCATSMDAEFRIVWPDGSVHYIRTAAKITRDPAGKATGMLGVNWDVTPLRQLSHELAQQHELLQVTLQSIGDAVITTDTRGRISWLNPVAEHMTGWLAAQAIGEPVTTVFKIVHESSRECAPDPVGHCINSGEVVKLTPDTVLLSRTGTEFGIEDSAAPIRSRNGELLGVVLVFHDVSEQRQLANEMQYRATHDMLTGLVNRAEFESRLQQALTMATQMGVHHALLYVDLDQFKLVNDSCGHSQGDQLLIQIAELIKNIVRIEDTVARIGGDEFALILKNCDIDRAKHIAQKICDSMAEFHFMHGDRRFRIGTSIGVVCLDHRWDTTEAAMQVADISCYAAKEEGRNRVHVWYDTDVALQERREGSEWVARIEQALYEDRFEIHAQRIHSSDLTLDSTCAEILIRMRDENGNLLYPNSFMSAAERFRLASRIDRWVLQKTIDTLLHLPNTNKLKTLFVNLSGQSVGDREFHRDAIQLLTDAGADICQKLCLEITETAAVTNIADASAFVDHVRTLGVRVALDDFGAGASSFGYLKTLKVDLLKIDGQFMEGVVDDPLDGAAVRCFVDVASVMGIKTVAEYVSNAEIFNCVKNIGVDYVQGFHLHKPQPINQALNPESKDVISDLLSRTELMT